MTKILKCTNHRIIITHKIANAPDNHTYNDIRYINLKTKMRHIIEKWCTCFGYLVHNFTNKEIVHQITETENKRHKMEEKALNNQIEKELQRGAR